MAHVKKMTDKARRLPWRAQIRRKGNPTIIKMFATKSEAEHWAAEHERSLRLTGLPITTEALKRHTFGELVKRYLNEVTPTKGCRVSETTVLKKLLRRTQLTDRSLVYLSRQDAHAYVKDRLRRP